MIYRFAIPDDGPEMLRLIESHPSGGGMKILYTRRPDAYKSYIAECAGSEIILCVNDDNHVLAQFVCMPRKLYINREAQTVGYVTGLHKEDGAAINIKKLFETGYIKSSAKQFFCSILDDNKAAYDLLTKGGLVRPICDYATYFIYPAAIKNYRHNFKFRRAVQGDTDRLLNFYNDIGSGYSYFPVFTSMNDFSGLTVTDYFLLEDGEKIIAAGALWNQRAYKQYIALGYRGVYHLASHFNPILRFLHYPPLPKKNTAADFAYISFMLCHKNNPDILRIFLGEVATAARGYDFLTVGAAKGDESGEALNAVKSIKIGSKLCIIDYDRNGSVPVYKTPLKFECALL